MFFTIHLLGYQLSGCIGQDHKVFWRATDVADLLHCQDVDAFTLRCRSICVYEVVGRVRLHFNVGSVQLIEHHSLLQLLDEMPHAHLIRTLLTHQETCLCYQNPYDTSTYPFRVASLKFESGPKMVVCPPPSFTLQAWLWMYSDFVMRTIHKMCPESGDRFCAYYSPKPVYCILRSFHVPLQPEELPPPMITVYWQNKTIKYVPTTLSKPPSRKEESATPKPSSRKEEIAPSKPYSRKEEIAPSKPYSRKEEITPSKEIKETAFFS